MLLPAQNSSFGLLESLSGSDSSKRTYPFRDQQAEKGLSWHRKRPSRTGGVSGRRHDAANRGRSASFFLRLSEQPVAEGIGAVNARMSCTALHPLAGSEHVAIFAAQCNPRTLAMGRRVGHPRNIRAHYSGDIDVLSAMKGREGGAGDPGAPSAASQGRGKAHGSRSFGGGT